jgi:hypothetical protein
MIPPLVSQALRLAADRGFDLSCTEEVGRLLHLLTGHQRTGTVGETPTMAVILATRTTISTNQVRSES